MSERGPDQKPQGWDAVTHGYEQTFEPFARLFAEEALGRARVGPSDYVLDVGAGPGALTLLAARTGARVLAIDFAPSMVERLRRRLADGGLTNARAEVMDGQALDLAEGSFDAAFSNFAVIFFPDLERGLAEMHRVLKSGGRVAVTAWGAPERMGVLRVLMRAVRVAIPDAPPPPQSPVLRLTDPDVFAGHLRGAGFRKIEVETLARDWVVPSPEWLAENLAKGFSPGLSFIFDRLGPEGTQRVLDILVAQLREEFGERGIRLSCEAHIGFGDK